MYHRSSPSQQERAVPVITYVVFSIYRANVELTCDKSSEKKTYNFKETKLMLLYCLLVYRFII